MTSMTFLQGALIGVAATCAVGLILYRGLEWYADRWGL